MGPFGLPHGIVLGLLSLLGLPYKIRQAELLTEEVNFLTVLEAEAQDCRAGRVDFIWGSLSLADEGCPLAGSLHGFSLCVPSLASPPPRTLIIFD